MPLIAMYKKQCMNIFKEELKQDQRKVKKALEKCDVKTVVVDSDFEKHTTNINTIKDLEILKDN
jgi:molybdopterin-guanine dinucleotide biosynthesis protein A